MDSETLRSILARLQQELIRAPRLSEEARCQLREAIRDVERLVDRSEASSSAQASTLADTSPLRQKHRLEALAVEFEAEHPTLAALVRQFIDVLAAAGL